MLNGDPKPFAELYAHGEDETCMGAEGTYKVGWEATYASLPVDKRREEGAMEAEGQTRKQLLRFADLKARGVVQCWATLYRWIEF